MELFYLVWNELKRMEWVNAIEMSELNEINRI